jgi:hypothetical protein
MKRIAIGRKNVLPEPEQSERFRVTLAERAPPRVELSSDRPCSAQNARIDRSLQRTWCTSHARTVSCSNVAGCL